MKNQLPNDLPTRLNLNRIEALFGGTDVAILSANDILKSSTLTRRQALSKGVEDVEECERVVSPFTTKAFRQVRQSNLHCGKIEPQPIGSRQRHFPRHHLAICHDGDGYHCGDGFDPSTRLEDPHGHYLIACHSPRLLVIRKTMPLAINSAQSN